MVAAVPTRSVLAVTAALALVAAGCRPHVAPPPPPPKLALVVLIVIDQLPSWGFEARQDLYQHGLRRLIREGEVFPRVAYPYAITFTAPGHAAIGTGAAPDRTGIVANGWYRRAQGRERQAEWDDGAPILGLPGRPADGLEGASSAALRVDGIADALEAATGGAARTVAIAGKPRAACFVAGRRPDVVLWYDAALRGMTSSRAYGDTLPAWLLALDAARPVADLLREVWAATDPAALAARTGIPDDAPGESGEHGLGVVFPHDLARTADAGKALRSTPLLDRLEVDTAIAAVDGEQLGADDTVDLLAVSFSAHDYAGHSWGQESWEMIELEQRLDRELGRLLDHLDRTVGADRYAVVLTSDHGATPMIEGGRHPGARRIAPAELEAVAEGAAAAALGAGDWIAAISSAMVYASPALLTHPDRDRALAAIAAALAEVPQVAQVVRLDAAPAGCTGLDALLTSACLSRFTGETGELLIVPTDGSLVTGYPAGTSHDAPSDDNRLVPAIVRVPGPHTRTDLPVPSALSIAPTVTELLGIAPPAAATAPPLVRLGRPAVR